MVSCLAVADQIQSASKTAEEIAAAMGLHALSLYRLLRALANFGLFAEQADGSFAHTPMSETLRSDVPYSMRGHAR
jgi:DNA-binding IclR family transcriptional regulator